MTLILGSVITGWFLKVNFQKGINLITWNLYELQSAFLYESYKHPKNGKIGIANFA